MHSWGAHMHHMWLCTASWNTMAQAPHLTCFQHACCAVKHALQVTCDLSSLIRQQLITLTPNHCQKLVDVHAGINSYLPAKIVVEVLLLDAFGSLVAKEFGQARDSHDWCVL